MFRFTPVVASQHLTSDTHHMSVSSQTICARHLIANREHQTPSEHVSSFLILDTYLGIRCVTTQSPLPMLTHAQWYINGANSS